MSVLIPYFNTRCGSDADYERTEITSKFSKGSDFVSGQVDHAYLNRYGRITFIDIQATTTANIVLNSNDSFTLFHVLDDTKKSLVADGCPIMGEFIVNGNKKIVCTTNFNRSGMTGDFYIDDVMNTITIDGSISNNMQFKGVYINRYEG